MRPPYDPPRRHRTVPATATTLTVLVAAVLLFPGTATANADTSTSCGDPLVTYTRDGVDGDRAAVALTAQSIERGVAGWDHVAWSAAAGTMLTGVYATDGAGTVTWLDASATGTAEGVVALSFCGTSGPVTASAVGSPEAVVTPEPEPDDGEGDAEGEGGSEDGSEGGSEEDTTPEDEVSIFIEFDPEAIIELDDAITEDDAEVADGDGDEATDPSNPPSGNEPTSEAGTQPSNPPSGNEPAAGGDAGVQADTGAGTDADTEAAAAAAETEVLGVTIVAEADGSRTEASGAAETSATDPTDPADPADADASADPIVAQKASSSEGPATPFLPVSVRLLLALAALLGTLAAIRTARSTEVSR